MIIDDDLNRPIDRYTWTQITAHLGGRPEAERKPAPTSPDQAGGRNNYFASRAGKLRRDGFDADAILAAIRSENASKGYDLPDRELVTIANSVGAYEVGDKADATILEQNIRKGLILHGLRIDAVGRFRVIATGQIARSITPPLLTDLIWRDLRSVHKVSAEDIGRLMGVEIFEETQRQYARISGQILGKPESPAALEELRRYVVAIAGTADAAVVGGFLQFLWCVKRSLAGLQREHDIMPILVNSIQGNGKSTAVRRLVSPLEELVDSITVETLADERKRADLGRFAVGVWDEMEGADKRDTDAIKSALSSQTVSYRPMRTNDSVTLVRIMNFIGTSNKPLAAMIRDSSGNRRFVEVETLPRLNHGAINDINYSLLWQAVSEHAEAPAKSVLVEIRTHQAGGRYQDSVSLWLEDAGFEAGASIPCDKVRDSYTEWCKRMVETPTGSSYVNSRLTAEGFKKSKRRTDAGREWVWIVPPARIDADVAESHNDRDFTVVTTNGPVPVPGQGGGPKPVDQQMDHFESHNDRLFTRVIDSGPLVHTNNDVQGKIGISPNRGNTVDHLDQWTTPPGTGLTLWVYDLEVFPNYFLATAWNGSRLETFDQTNIAGLAHFVADPNKVLAGFNNHAYDDVIVGAIKSRRVEWTAEAIHALSKRIIEPATTAEKDLNFQDRYRKRPWAYSIDVFQLLNGKGSLKEWECRIGFPTVAESPADFEKDLPPETISAVRQYCENDVRATARLLLDRWDLVTLRATLADQFNLGDRVYCLSEQGLAQTTFLSLHRERTSETTAVVRNAAAAAPENQAERLPLADLLSERVRFETDPFRAFVGRIRTGALVKSDKGSWSIELDGSPMDETFRLAGVEVSLGVGGLHTVDAPGIFEANAETAIVDLDVTSYYPSLMIGERIFPSQLGEAFLEDFTALRTKRIAAKVAGDKPTAEALKIVLNATYGKLNDNWSPIRSVSNAFRVTMNGQMYLLMLMEALAAKGFEILSANTDGVTIRGPKHRMGDDINSVVHPWQAATGLALEAVQYAKVARRDVNTYVAVTDTGKTKVKGAFNADAGKGDGQVIRRAAIAYLLEGTDPSQTVAMEASPSAFLFYQRAKNGGDLYLGPDHIGKTARWFVTTAGPALKRKNPDGSFDTIPNGHHIAPALDITGWTRDSLTGLDAAYYVSAAWDLIRQTGAGATPV